MKVLLLAALLLLPGQPRAQGGAEAFGPWLLTCVADRMTDRAECRLLHRQPVEPAGPGQAALALEAVERGGRLVPAVTARDLTLEGAGRGLLALAGGVQLRFPPNRVFEMPCGLEGRSVLCVPREEEWSRAAAELAAAERVLARAGGPFSRGASGGEPAELRLSDTPAALAAYRARVPEGSSPPRGGLDAGEVLSRLLRWLGN